MYKSILFTLLVFSFSFSLSAQTKSEKLLAKIIAAEDRGDYKGAIGYLDELVKEEPDNYTVYLSRATNYMQLDQFDKALPDLDKSIKLNPSCGAYYNRSYCHTELENNEKAIADANSALEICGTDHEYAGALYVTRGTCKGRKRDFTGAYNDFMLAYAIDSTQVEVLASLATVAYKIGKDSMSLVYHMRAYAIDSMDATVLNNIGFFYLAHGDFEKSAVFMKKVIDIKKDSPYAWNNLGYCKYKMGDNKGAMDDINQSLKLDPSNSYAWRNRALVYLALSNKVAACADLEKALQLGYSGQYGYDVQELYNKNCK